VTRRYAQNTAVPVERSRMDIEKYLMKRGADEFASASDQTRSMIQFRLNGWTIRLTMPMLTVEKDRKRGESPEVFDRRRKRTSMQRWRALFAVVKAKLAAVEAGIVSLEQEFLPHIVVAGRETVYEAMRRQGLGSIVSGTNRLLTEGES
jgi:hypothetical protein